MTILNLRNKYNDYKEFKRIILEMRIILFFSFLSLHGEKVG